MTRRARLTVAYDGAAYHGFAENAGVETVAGSLRAALEQVVRAPLELTGAGRTDAGVHGWGQVVSVDLPEPVDLHDLAHRVTRMLGPTIVVRDATWVDDTFDARFSALWRHYRYTVLSGETPDPFLAATAWHVPQRLDLGLMRLACDPLVGEHDFSSFCRRPAPPRDDPDAPAPSMVRRVLSADWSVPDPDRPEVLRFEIKATAFCHQMVRSIVGTLVEVGRRKRRAGEMMGILLARDRSAAGIVAPPHGLCLWAVGYPDAAVDVAMATGVDVEHDLDRS